MHLLLFRYGLRHECVPSVEVRIRFCHIMFIYTGILIILYGRSIELSQDLCKILADLCLHSSIIISTVSRVGMENMR